MAIPTNSTASLAMDSRSIDDLRRSAKEQSPEALKEAAKQFEALFMNMIMKSMRAASPQEGLFDNEQTRMYTSMLDQQMSQNFANRGMGLADLLVSQLSRNLATQAPTDGQMPTDPIYSAASAEARQYNSWHPASLAASNAYQSAMSGSSQPQHVQAFRNRLEAHAQEASRTTGIPARFMLGQAALESGWGKKEILAADGSTSHNLFGIKAGPGWKGKVVESVTTEYVNGLPIKSTEKFRAYDSYADAFRDYANFLRSNPRYKDVLANAHDVQGFAQGLQRAGYATDPEYAAKLTRIITQNLST